MNKYNLNMICGGCSSETTFFSLDTKFELGINTPSSVEDDQCYISFQCTCGLKFTLRMRDNIINYRDSLIDSIV
jgi:hypothetical protein